VVHGNSAKGQESHRARSVGRGLGAPAEAVQLYRVEGFEDCVQAVRFHVPSSSALGALFFSSFFLSPFTRAARLCITPCRFDLVMELSPFSFTFILHSHQLSPSRSYASLYFVIGVDPEDNELNALEIIHHFVEVLDRYFGNVRIDERMLRVNS
jgi:hypothetical protein